MPSVPRHISFHPARAAERTGMTTYEAVQERSTIRPRTWLVTGVAGFIGSNLLETLLKLDQRVVGLDNFSAGKKSNLEEVAALAGPERWGQFRCLEADIKDLTVCRKACAGVDF